MKILEIRLNNLNSLKGRHTIDLTDERIAGAGLFAITGPTGAGKSTILDAVTLALYGRAARYGTQANPEDMMSRHTGECWAEVDFAVPSGTYRATWELHRAQKRPDGKLQSPTRQLYQRFNEKINEDVPVATRIYDVATQVEDLIGLDYDRFLRSVLLPQGEFARFLKAPDNERARLLESLTGTEVYTRLSQLAHEERNRRQSDLTVHEREIAQIPVLDEQARLELDRQLAQTEEHLDNLAKQIERDRETIRDIDRLEEALERKRQAIKDQEQVQRQKEARSEDLRRLNAHERAQPYVEPITRLDAADQAYREAATRRQEAEHTWSNARARLADAYATFVSSMNTAIHESRSALTENARQARTAEQRLEELNAWISERAEDEIIAERILELDGALADLQNRREAFATRWEGWSRIACETFPDLQTMFPADVVELAAEEIRIVVDKILSQARTNVAALEQERDRAARELTLRQDHLRKAQLLAKYEDQRHTLVSGEPCPLCGATEHPYAEGAAPSPQIAEIQASVDSAEEARERARRAADRATGALALLTDGRAALVTSIEARDTARQALAGLLKPLSLDVPEPAAEWQLRNALKDRAQAFTQTTKARDEAANRQSAAEQKSQDLGRRLEELQDKLNRLQAWAPADVVAPAGGKTGAPHETAATVRKSPTGAVPATAPIASAGAGLPVDKAEQHYNSALAQGEAAVAQLESRRRDEKSALERLDTAQTAAEAAVNQSDFETLDALQAALLPEAAIRKLRQFAEQIQNQESRATALLEQAKSDIASLEEKQVLSGEAADVFKRNHNKNEQKRDQLFTDRTTLSRQISEDDANRKLRHQKDEALKEERRSLVVWQRLHELIGSHDGKKFRLIAQGITLDILTARANRHLERLTDRYRIQRMSEAAAAPLNLKIQDLHQAGVCRPMSSLSGGESFLASLALALGLSDLAGRTVRIDSLFIDEGFGSLDSETLDVAISALESLRQNGKIVGIISHVSLLKERLAAQVQVRKLTGGVSAVQVVG